MKVKFIKISANFEAAYGQDGVTLGNVYECEGISEFGEAKIKNDKGFPSILDRYEYEVVEE